MGELIQQALLNKDVFTTLVLLGVMAALIPIIVGQNKKQQENIEKLIKSNNDTLEKGFDKICLAVGKTIVQDEVMLVAIGEKAIQSATSAKLGFLRTRLIQNDIHKNPEQIKNHIKTRLLGISEKSYIDFLNGIYTPVGLYGRWVGKNFPMDKFLETIYKVFFSDNTIDRKVELMESIMYDFQSEMWEKFRLELNK